MLFAILACILATMVGLLELSLVDDESATEQLTSLTVAMADSS